MFIRVPSMLNPWITSVVVAVKTISAPAGTRISAGLNDHAWPTITASYLPGPSRRTPGRSKGAVRSTSRGSMRPSSPGRWIPIPTEA
jgi:hypothetical protein